MENSRIINVAKRSVYIHRTGRQRFFSEHERHELNGNKWKRMYMIYLKLAQ
jgi:hypothetical protein